MNSSESREISNDYTDSQTYTKLRLEVTKVQESNKLPHGNNKHNTIIEELLGKL